MKILCLLSLVFLVSTNAAASVVTNVIEYRIGNQDFKSFLYYHSFSPGKKPGILLLPEWWGLNRDIKEKAQKLAKEGYVVMAVDMYGEGHATEKLNEASRLMRKTQANNHKLAYQRFIKAWNFLRKYRHVDSERLAVVGFTYGGSLGLEMARRSVDLKAVVNFHGGLTSSAKGQPKKILARVLVLVGQKDKFITPRMIRAFEGEMKKLSVRYDIKKYPKAISGFSNPYIDKIAKKNGLAMRYNPKVAERAWNDMARFLKTNLK